MKIIRPLPRGIAEVVAVVVFALAAVGEMVLMVGGVIPAPPKEWLFGSGAPTFAILMLAAPAAIGLSLYLFLRRSRAGT